MKKTYSGLDIGKFICALFILFYHYFSEHGPLPGIFDEMLSLYAVAVATFMAISGFLVFDKIKNVEEKKGRWFIVRKQVFRILKIYVLWSIPYLIYTICCWNMGNITIKFLFWEIQGWIFQSTFYTIWFMPALAIGLFIAFWITEKIPQKIVIVLAFCMYVVGSLLLTYSYLGAKIPGYVVFNDFVNTWLGGARGGLFYAFPLIILGKTVVNVKDKIKPWIMMILASLCMTLLIGEALVMRNLVGHTGIDLAFMMIPVAFCIVGFLVSVKIPSGRYNVWMRKMSTLIFVSQRLFLTVIPSMLKDDLYRLIFSNNYIGAVFVMGSVILFSVILVQLSNKFKWLKNFY